MRLNHLPNTNHDVTVLKLAKPKLAKIVPLLDNDNADARGLVSEQLSMWLSQTLTTLDTALANGVSIRQVVQAHVAAVDDLLVALFEHHQLKNHGLALFAVGGYGRGELARHSDVDILLLYQNELATGVDKHVEQFVTTLWDIGLEPSLAVRSVSDTMESAHDHTVATALLEARLLTNDPTLTCNLAANFGKIPHNVVNDCWGQEEFYHAKMNESKKRHLAHNATEYNLEPNIKSAPGGLRDIHTVGWVSKRYFRVNKLFDLVQQAFITEREYDELIQAEEFLWQIRHHLHQITGRNQNQLLFDHQREVANRMGYQQSATDPANTAVERFMKDYYRCAMHISTLSEMLTNHYYETLIEARLPDADKPQRTTLTALFNRIGDQIAIAHHRVFAQYPEAILHMFLLMGQHGIKKVRTRTLRALKVAACGIDQAYRDNPKHQQLFLANLKEQNYLFHRLRTMKRYGVLGSYLPAFGQVVGLMQYDLFHRYTVDAHTLLVIRVLHRFIDPKYKEVFGLVSGIYQRIERKEILVLAAIFHDIAKGRGGNHSVLGETDAVAFCLAHGLSDADAKLVGWLVRQHLLMSNTAQKKDILDPQVITNFAHMVGNVTQLNHLYVLTVADMTATNPKLWNSWRATLMKQLYTRTRSILRADIDAPTNRQEMITATREQAIKLLDDLYTSQDLNTSQTDVLAFDRKDVLMLWDELGDEYFLREIPEDILWHTHAILTQPPVDDVDNVDNVNKSFNINRKPLIVLREHRDLALDAVQVFIYTQNQDNLFAVTMAVFDLMGLDVLDARIITGTRDFALDSYVLLDHQGTLLTDVERQDELKWRLVTAFANPTQPKLAHKRLPRQLKHFSVPTQVRFETVAQTGQHILYLTALDQPSLLARVGAVFLQHGIEVHAARITTLGEKAQDLFYISDRKDNRLSDDKLNTLTQTIIDILDN